MQKRSDQEADTQIGDLVLDKDIPRETLQSYPLDRKTPDVCGAHSGAAQNIERKNPAGGTGDFPLYCYGRE